MNSALKKAALLFLSSVAMAIACAQQQSYKWMVGVNGGIFVYQGDLVPSALGSYRTAQPVFGFSVTRIINSSFAVRGNAAFGKLYGNDNKFSTPFWRQYRRLSFSTPVKEFSAQLVWNLYSNNSNETGQRFSPYVFIGAGISSLNITRDYSNIDTTFFPWSSKQQTGLRRDTTVTPPRSAFVLPMGAGVSYYLGERWSLNYEFNFRYMFTDYLDGFSYVANPNLKDFYHSHTLGIMYRFGGGDGSSSGKNGDKLGCPKF